MPQLNTLLELRTRIKNKKPVFIRQDNPKRPKLSDKWRKQKGIHSKIRHHFKGRRKMPSPGYKSPLETRGLHAAGLCMIMVHSPKEVSMIKKDSQGIIIPRTVGAKKRLEILKTAKSLNVRVLNLDSDKAIKKIEDFMNSKKGKTTKEAGKEPVKEPKKEATKETKEMTEEQKKEAEKKEKDRVLTRKA